MTVSDERPVRNGVVMFELGRVKTYTLATPTQEAIDFIASCARDANGPAIVRAVNHSPLDLFGDVSTADTGFRSPYDFYPTPGWMVRSLLAHHPGICGSRVFECCAGRGDITRELLAVGCTVVENDLDPAHGRDYRSDMTVRERWEDIAAQEGPFDYVVTNLAFNVAYPILWCGLDFVLKAFCTILPKSFDEPTEDRGPWLAAHPYSRKICLPRHRFRGTGSPPMASDWFIWEREPDRALPPIAVDHLAEER